MWRLVDIVWTDVSEERNASIYSYLLTLVHRLWISYTLKMEALRSSETSVNKISTRRHTPKDGILQVSYLVNYVCKLVTVLGGGKVASYAVII
jgi:hypothetical protein